MKENLIEKLQKQHNPNNEPVGHFTGRCEICHSKDLWDDVTAYGCNCCGAIFMNIMPIVIENATGRVFEFE